VARSFKQPQPDFSDAKLVAIVRGQEIELRRCGGPKDNTSAGFGSEFAVTRDEVRMQMSLDDVLDREPVLAGFVEVDLNVAAWIHHRSFALRANEV
jgi:hypothetical protein